MKKYSIIVLNNTGKTIVTENRHKGELGEKDVFIPCKILYFWYKSDIIMITDNRISLKKNTT